MKRWPPITAATTCHCRNASTAPPAGCQRYLPGYCREVGLPEDGADFAAELKAAMKDLAIRVDAGYPGNADLVIEEDGRPSLKARKGAERTASARALEAEVKERLPERSLLEVLARATRWVGWHRHLGPLSGSDPKLADPLERYMLAPSPTAAPSARTT